MPIPKPVVDGLFVVGGIAGGLALCYGAYKCIKSFHRDIEQEVEEDEESEDEESEDEESEDEESEDEEEVFVKEFIETQRMLEEAQKTILQRLSQLEENQRTILQRLSQLEENQRKSGETQKVSSAPTQKKTGLQSRVEDLIRSRSGVVGEVELSPHELIIAASLVDPSQLDTTWCNVAGLDDVVKRLRAEVLLTVQQKHLTAGIKLLSTPQGVLLHGPPGCGKTLIASALAKEADFPFIHIKASTLMSKWHGETEKLTDALFTFAVRLQPCIIFIDEIDSLLRSRSDLDSDPTNKFKALFLESWAGLGTGNNQVIVMGATNRRQDIDEAFLSRISIMFHITLPSQTQREEILKEMLKDFNLDPSVDLCDVSEQAEGFSGRDLKQVCRHAAMLCLGDSVGQPSLRPARQSDLLEGIAMRRENKR